MCEIAEELISKGKAEGIALGKIEGRTEAIAENKEMFTAILKEKFGLSHEDAIKVIDDSFSKKSNSNM